MQKDSSRIRGTTREIEQAARQLRQNLTLAEERLWSALRGKHLMALSFAASTLWVVSSLIFTVPPASW